MICVVGSKGHHFVKLEEALQILFLTLKIKFKLLIYLYLAQISILSWGFGVLGFWGFDHKAVRIQQTGFLQVPIGHVVFGPMQHLTVAHS